MEQWKEVEDTNGKYLISNKGNLKSLCRKNPLIVKPFEDKDGYLKFAIKRKNKLIHRLVALAFKANPKNKPEVNHKDGNKKNNEDENLEWATRAENAQHAYDTNLCKAKGGENHYAAKLTDEIVLIIKKTTGESQKNIGKKHGISQSVVSEIVNSKTWKHIKN